jgi:hypothetical protein
LHAFPHGVCDFAGRVAALNADDEGFERPDCLGREVTERSVNRSEEEAQVVEALLHHLDFGSAHPARQCD